MEGLVTRSTGSWYEVLTAAGTSIPCRLQGKHRLADSKESNPVAVGDRVAFIMHDKEGSITEIKPRRNHILRKSVKKTDHQQVLAANVDQVLLVATLKQPRTSLGFIDRFLVTAEAFRIPQILIINKMDLLDADERADAGILQNLYQSIGVRVLVTSTLSQDAAPAIRGLLHGRITLLAGHSGVGKSTLLNLVSPGVEQKISQVSEFTNKGTHTTTFAQMFRLDNDTFVIDTPGVKEWGLADTEAQEISDYFPEMRELRNDCKFGSRCLHLTEPHCAVRQSVEKGTIAVSRYESYVSMVMGFDNRK